MKTLIYLIILLSPVTVLASPFLVCDPQAGVETYEVYMDGVLLASDIAAQPDGSLRYDLVDVTPGQYNFTARACDVWRCSDPSNPYQSPAGVSVPSGLRMVK